MGHAELLTGAERRRRWSDDERERILSAAFAPGAVVSRVARHFGVSSGLIYTWRKATMAGISGPAFLPARLADTPAFLPQSAAAITITLPSGVVVTVPSGVPNELVATVLRALK
jgi:transposase